ncbi:MAG TPA: PilZ domain-containing protein [Acidimicrobiales bacterium]|nr:PilZ domain-containing protein [Acidimicrobiales bacterium]
MTHTDGLTDLVGRSALVEAGPLEVTGCVTGVEASGVTVELDEANPATGEIGAVVVSVFAPDALYRVAGPATVSGRELVVGEAVSIERIQRRRWPRRALTLPVTLCPVSEGLRMEGVPGRTVDVGIGGCSVETLRPLDGEGDPMVILSLPDGTTIVSATSTVAVEDLGDGWRYRLAFRDLEAHEAGRLADLTA